MNIGNTPPSPMIRFNISSDILRSIFCDPLDKTSVGNTPYCEVLYNDKSFEFAFEFIEGIGHDTFIQRQTRLLILLGFPVIYPNGTAYWQSRRKWKVVNRRHSLTNWSTQVATDTNEKTTRLTFSKEIYIRLIAPKEGPDFDLDKETPETYANYKQLTCPLLSEEDYREYWVTSPFPKDNGALRPFYHTAKMRSHGWCLCKNPPLQKPGRAISCRKCLNMELRQFVRKCTPEQFKEQYLKNISE